MSGEQRADSLFDWRLGSFDWRLGSFDWRLGSFDWRLGSIVGWETTESEETS
jgi:hypothetical protein